jgi:hypothetical protein
MHAALPAAATGGSECHSSQEGETKDGLRLYVDYLRFCECLVTVQHPDNCAKNISGQRTLASGNDRLLLPQPRKHQDRIVQQREKRIVVPDVKGRTVEGLASINIKYRLAPMS